MTSTRTGFRKQAAGRLNPFQRERHWKEKITGEPFGQWTSEDSQRSSIKPFGAEPTIAPVADYRCHARPSHPAKFLTVPSGSATFQRSSPGAGATRGVIKLGRLIKNGRVGHHPPILYQTPQFDN